MILKKEVIITKIENQNSLSEVQQIGIKHAILAMNNANATYSNFTVGCSLILDNETIIYGSNQENPAYPSGICAERSALFSLASQFKKFNIKLLTITAMHNNKFLNQFLVPCGACLQVMSHFETLNNNPIPILIYTSPRSIYFIENVGQFLPFKFQF